MTTGDRKSRFYQRGVKRAKVAYEPFYASLQRQIELNKRKSLDLDKVEELEFRAVEAGTGSIIETTEQNVIETTFEDRIRIGSARGSLTDDSKAD